MKRELPPYYYLVHRVAVEGLRPEETAQGVSVRTLYKWLKRYRKEGETGLQNRASRPRHCPHATPDTIREEICERRRE
ncbi:hypothetical protein GCM10022394_07770 [Zobellella aerophila]|uniref:DNA-binding domain-containing protein n=1 Tax=Zobellella aerophila TaxID=870480 RepID=A0ABP6VBJ5_9GAMM